MSVPLHETRKVRLSHDHRRILRGNIGTVLWCLRNSAKWLEGRRERDRQTDRQIDRQRQIGRQREREREREMRERHTHTERERERRGRNGGRVQRR